MMDRVNQRRFKVSAALTALFGTGLFLTSTALASTDFDGDGCDDLALYDPARYRWFVRTASNYPISGGPSVLLWDFAWGFAGASALAGDYDYNGKDDICTFAPSTCQFYAYALTGNALVWGLPCSTIGSSSGYLAVKR